MKFNQVVGVDLVEFKEGFFDKILVNIVRWGTGFQMAVVIPNKTSQTVKMALA